MKITNLYNLKKKTPNLSHFKIVNYFLKIIKSLNSIKDRRLYGSTNKISKKKVIITFLGMCNSLTTSQLSLTKLGFFLYDLNNVPIVASTGF